MATARSGGRRGSGESTSAEERAQAERDLERAVADLQEAAYGNLRAAVAHVAIFFGFVGGYTAFSGVADGPRMVPTAVLILAGVVGAAYYPARPRWKLATRLLVASSALVVIGLAGLVVMTMVLDA